MGESSLMTTKHFECEECGAHGKIMIKGDDTHLEDIVYCPVCSADIYEEEKFDEEE
jgi:predicted nucleic acid-binding Zn ribbon protein